ncbi:5687_t:CDS:1 [Ambispora gerdemannii]|uniref:5687_t:CDS:1 n=1 Tax=Ambispora gerdemannii TaxID=144530 RepID=A0A9N8ZUV9_9GLOM|nr:5687_t:CDS:1 [Ambispora gerdemannii]
MSVVSYGPMEHLQMDLVDFTAYKEQNDGFAWLLTIVCIFSKFFWAIPLKTKETVIIEDALVSLFAQWGVPSILQSDNDKEFVSNIIKNICMALGITIRHDHPRYPQSQGQIERLNQTIRCGFTKMMWDEENQLQNVNWKDNLQKFIFSYNTTRHSAHNKTPCEVMFGYKLLGIYQKFNLKDIEAVQEIDNSPEIQVANTVILSQVVREHLEKITAIQDNINNQLEKSCKYMIKHSNVHRHTNILEPGQSVTIAPDTDMNPSTRKRKLEVTFKDTGTIIGITNNNKTVIIETPEKNTKRCPSKRVRRLKKVDS